jgi:DNA-binding NarL/FixJ family response regulator
MATADITHGALSYGAPAAGAFAETGSRRGTPTRGESTQGASAHGASTQGATAQDPSTEPNLFRTLTRRGPIAAFVIDADDRLVMASDDSIAMACAVFELERPPALLEVVPTALKRHSDALRTALTVPGAAPLVRISAELCCRGCVLRDEVEKFLLFVFERTARRNTALLNLENYGLTPRERDVARLMLLGLTSRAIAARIGATTNTVESHTKRILTKVGAQTRAALVWKILARDEGSSS